MKKTRVCAILLLVMALACCFAYAAPEMTVKPKKSGREKLVVLDLKAKYGIEDGFAEACSVLIRDEIHSYGEYEVMSTDDLQAVMSREAMLQAMGCDEDGSCLVSFGRAIGTRFMVAGSLSKLGNTYNISLRILDTRGQNAGVVKRTGSSCKCSEDELIAAVRQAAADLAGKEKKEMRKAEGNAGELYFIDAHSQVDHNVVPLSKIISLMDSAGVRQTILSSRGDLKGKTLRKFSRENPERILAAVRTKGNAYNTGSNKYYDKLTRQINTAQYRAIAEVLLYHARKGSRVPEIIVYPDDRRVQTTLEYAVENDWPLVVHIEFASLDGQKRKKFMSSFEYMLDQHPEQPFILTHMGQLSRSRCLRLIKNHKNIYFHTGWANPAAVQISNQPWTNVFKGDRLDPEWKDLFVKYPERFIFALDNVFAEHWSDLYREQMSYWRKGFAELPADAADLIAHGNAERLWRMPVRK